MCLSTGGSPPPPIAPVAPPPPPQQITVASTPTLMQIPPKENEQLRPDSPVKKRRGTKRRGKSMLKIPLNTSGGGINV